MEETTLKNNEIKNLKKANQNLESAYKYCVIASKGHEQRVKSLEEQVKILRKEFNLSEQVAYIKNHLWKKFIEGIHSQWPSI